MTAAQVLNLNRRYRTLNTSNTIGNGIDLVLSSRGEITLQNLFWVIVVKVNAYSPMPSHPVRSVSLHSTPSGFDIYDIK